MIKGRCLTLAEINYKTKNKDNVRLTVKLNEIFGEVSDRPLARERFGQALIDKIVENTQSGMDKNGKPLKTPYKDSYAKTVGFKAFGKSKNQVNMTLRGSMLSNLDVLKTTKNTVTIGWEPGSTNGQKAHGHINGSKSKKGKRLLPKRDFFGLPKEKIKDLKEEFEKDFKKATVSDFISQAGVNFIRNLALGARTVKDKE